MKRNITLAILTLFSFVAYAQRSEGTASASLPGRSLVGSLHKLTTSGLVDGTVIVTIKVDQYGYVTEAVAGDKGSTINNSSVLTAARAAAMRAHFNTRADAPVVQVGTITYTFVSSGLAETDDSVLRFVGVPIGGSKETMFEALKARGFEKVYLDDYMTGVFNGENVQVHFSTNHGIVDVVKVVYPYCSEENDTRIKYNLLLSRFNRNAKYICVNPRVEVPIDERIYWKLDANSKHYDAIYFFLRPEINANDWVADFKQEYHKRNNKPLEGLSYEEMEEALFSLPMRVSAAISGVVWFTMVDIHRININYVNLNNRPRGEDL